MKASQRRKSRGDRRTEALRRGAERTPGQDTGEAALPATARPSATRGAAPEPRVSRAYGGSTVPAAPVAGGATAASWWARARLDVGISCLFMIAALALFLPRIEEPPKYIYDEVYHAYTAAQYAIGNTDAWLWSTQAPIKGVAYEWTHPPLGKLIMMVGVMLFGDNSVGWRFMSAIFGALGLAAIYWLALSLTGKRVVAIIASILTLADGLYFVESRTGVIDIFGAVFMVGAFTAFYAFLVAPPTKVRTPLLLLGLFMGLGIANKWNAVYPSVLIGLFVLWRTAAIFLASRRPRATEETTRGFIQHLIWVPIGGVVVSLGVYLLSYVPFFLAGHTVDQLIELQRQMYYYHSHLKATHAYQSTWYQWPAVWRPVWYSVTYDVGGDNMIANTYANGNPLLYWSFFLAVPYAVIRWWSKGHAALPVLLIGFFGQWLPWAMIPRIAYIYHFLPASIFGTLALAVMLNDFWEWGKAAISWRAVAVAYVTVIVVAFAFFYPIYSSVNLTDQQFEARLWLKSWR